MCFQSDDTLYGRHWGSKYNIDSLHFECCYYQGIDYCIKNKIASFDPGVQGEHKIRRGFEPEKTSSYHYIKEKDFYKAINEFSSILYLNKFLKKKTLNLLNGKILVKISKIILVKDLIFIFYF